MVTAPAFAGTAKASASRLEEKAAVAEAAELSEPRQQRMVG
jgi:hypothetical protein